jgi:7-carboxy-7-deazaguanine synthase
MQIDHYRLADKVDEILFSPSFTELPSRDLADWIIADNLPVRMQLQLHKLIWGEERGR